MIYKRIGGSTKTLGLIGNPVKHTYSPIIHNTITNILNEEGYSLDCIYVPFETTEQNLDCAIKGAHALGIGGFNVTVPHKINVIQHACDLDHSAIQIGAVNTLKYTENGYVGYNTDIIGVTETFRQYDISLQNKTVLIFGAGGGAAAALFAVLQHQPAQVYIVNRTIQNAHNIAEIANRYYSESVSVLSYDQYENFFAKKDIDLAVQATSVGLCSEDSIVRDKAFFEKISVCLDMVYNPWETTFLRDAKSYGAICINGFNMLLFQAIASYEIFHDIKLDQSVKFRLVDLLTDYFIAYA